MTGTIARPSIQCINDCTRVSMMASAWATAAWRFSKPDCTTVPKSSTVYKKTSSNWATSGSISRGTARSTIKTGLCLRAFTTRSTRPRPMIGKDDAVQETTMSNCANCCGRSARRIALPLKRWAKASTRYERQFLSYCGLLWPPQTSVGTSDADKYQGHLQLPPDGQHLSFVQEFVALPTPSNPDRKQLGMHAAQHYLAARCTNAAASRRKVNGDSQLKSGLSHPPDCWRGRPRTILCGYRWIK